MNNYLPFRAVWVDERCVIPVFTHAPETKDDNYRSFIRVNQRLHDETREPVPGMFRIVVPCRGNWPDAGHVIVQVAPNRTHIVDVTFYPGSNVPCVAVTDIGPNNVSEYQAFYPWHEFERMEKDGIVHRCLVAEGYRPEDGLAK